MYDSCPKCDAGLHQGQRECPRCGVIVAKYRAREIPSPHHASAPVEDFKPPRNWTIPAILAGVGLVVALIAYESKGGASRMFPTDGIEQSVTEAQWEDPCAAKSKCLVVLVTPWCPSCHRSLGVFQAWYKQLKNSSQAGMKIIVGNGRTERMKAMALKIGEGAYIDTKNQIMTTLRVRSVPHFFILDRSGKIEKMGAFSSIRSDVMAVLQTR